MRVVRIRIEASVDGDRCSTDCQWNDTDGYCQLFSEPMELVGDHPVRLPVCKDAEVK